MVDTIDSGAKVPLRKLLSIGLFLFVAAFLLAFVTIPSDLYLSYLNSKLSNAAQKAGVTLRLEDPKLSGVGVFAKRASVVIPKYLTGIELSNTRCHLSLASLLRLAVNVKCNGEAYLGHFNVEYETSLFSSPHSVKIELNSLNLSSHAQIAGFGITEGVITVTSKELKLKTGSLTGAIHVHGERIKKDNDSVFGIPGSSNFVALPKFSDLGFDFEVIINPNEITYQSFLANSSLGSAKSPNGKLAPVSTAKFDIKLSRDAKKNYGQLISIASNSALTPDIESFSINVSGNWPRLKANLVAQ